MRIKCLTTFKDGRDRFDADDVRSVDDDRGAYFIANGWAVQHGAEAEAQQQPQGDAALDIQGGAMGQGVSNG